jgi:hypothetical protein
MMTQQRQQRRRPQQDGGMGKRKRPTCQEDVCDAAIGSSSRYRIDVASTEGGSLFEFPDRGLIRALYQDESSNETLGAWLKMYYYLLNVAFVSQFLTDDIRADLESYKGKNLRFVNPIQADGKTSSERTSAWDLLRRVLMFNKAPTTTATTTMAGPFDPQADEEEESRVEQSFSTITQEADDLWHMPLWSAGSPEGNGMFCRASVCHSMPDTLWLSFRPLNLVDLEKLVKFSSLHTYLKRFTSRIGIEYLSHDQKTIDNLLYITLQLSSTAIDESTGISEGYMNLLTRSPIQVTTENVVERLRTSTVPAWPFHPAYFGRQQCPSICDAIATFLADNRGKFKRVVFSGFSLGSGSALASAVLVHRKLQQVGPTPDFHVVQLSGTMVGTADVAGYAEEHFASCLYLALRNTSERGNDIHDPVTYMPYDPRFRHAGVHMVLDFARHNVFLSTGFDPSAHKQGSNPWIKLMASMVTGMNLGGSYVGFAKTHMAGERMIVRTMLYNIVQNWKANSGKAARTAASEADPPGSQVVVQVPKWILMVPCEYYSIAGTAAKHKLCPDVMCMMTVKVMGDRTRSVCIRRQNAS